MAILQGLTSSSKGLASGGYQRDCASETHFVTLTITREHDIQTKTIRLGNTGAEDGIAPTTGLLPTQQTTPNAGGQSSRNDQVAILVGVLLGVFFVGLGIAWICWRGRPGPRGEPGLPGPAGPRGEPGPWARGVKMVTTDEMEGMVAMGETAVMAQMAKMVETADLDKKGRVGRQVNKVRKGIAVLVCKVLQVPRVHKGRAAPKGLPGIRVPLGHQGSTLMDMNGKR